MEKKSSKSISAKIKPELFLNDPGSNSDSEAGRRGEAKVPFNGKKVIYKSHRTFPLERAKELLLQCGACTDKGYMQLPIC